MLLQPQINEWIKRVATVSNCILCLVTIEKNTPRKTFCKWGNHSANEEIIQQVPPSTKAVMNSSNTIITVSCVDGLQERDELLRQDSVKRASIMMASRGSSRGSVLVPDSTRSSFIEGSNRSSISGSTSFFYSSLLFFLIIICRSVIHVVRTYLSFFPFFCTDLSL